MSFKHIKIYLAFLLIFFLFTLFPNRIAPQIDLDLINILGLFILVFTLLLLVFSFCSKGKRLPLYLVVLVFIVSLIIFPILFRKIILLYVDKIIQGVDCVE